MGCDLRRMILLIMLSVTGTPVLCFHCQERRAERVEVVEVCCQHTWSLVGRGNLSGTHQMPDEHGGDDDVRKRGRHVPGDANEPVPPHLRERGLQDEGDRAAYPAH